METKEKVKKFKADLEIKPKLFNIWAFIFSSFYFLFTEMFLYFYLFFILTFIIAIPFVHLFDIETGLLIGFICSHTIAGFVANPCRRKYKQKFIETHEYEKKVNYDAQVEYFAISLSRLIICTILTGGLYTIYWGYKNWNNFQKATNIDINPYIQGFFFNFTVMNLFDIIEYSTKSKKSYDYYGMACFIIFISEGLIYNDLLKLSDNQDKIPIYLLSLFTLMLVYPFCIVPVQMLINKYTKETLKKPLDNHFYFGEIVILASGIFLNLYYWCNNLFIKNTF